LRQKQSAKKGAGVVVFQWLIVLVITGALS